MDFVLPPVATAPRIDTGSDDDFKSSSCMPVSFVS
jgi:hypothetical protein